MARAKLFLMSMISWVIMSNFGCNMKQLFVKFWFFLMVLMVSPLQAAVCPDPNNSSLQYGVIPAPWALNPFSEHYPQGEVNTKFIRSNILVVGFGRGVLCTYKNSVGYYSIWWEVNVKIPAPIDYRWRDTRGGFECNTSLEACEFYTA
jgi:hypothetical protein